jgi:hypothetical protein
MDFFVWQGRRRERSRESVRHAARLRSGMRCKRTRTLQGSSSVLLAGIAALACKPVCALQAQEE